MSDTFDPSKHLMELRGKGGTSEYMPVKWRIVWLRHDHPDAIIETECVFREEREAGFRARVTLPGGGSATGWGSETAGDFKDYYEKAETKALGRALAALGYGTQFVGNELDEGERIVESPVNRKRGRREEMDEDNDPDAQRFDDAHQPASPTARTARTPPPPSGPRPAAASSAAAGTPTMTDAELLASISNVNLDPDARWNALWDYYERATTVAELNTRADVAYESGMEARDLKAAYKQNHDRLSKLFAPVPTATNPHPPEPSHSGDQATQRATERQVKFIRAIAQEAGLDAQELAAWSLELYQQDVEHLNRRDAGTLIEALQRRRNEVA